MENTVQKKLMKVSPYLRGIIYDQNSELYVRLHVMIPKVWSYKILINSSLVLNVDSNEVSNILTIGLDPKKSKDVAVDELLDSLEEVIEFNKKEAKKRKLLRERIKQMEQMSLEDIEELSLPKIAVDDIEDDEEFIIPIYDPMENKFSQPKQHVVDEVKSDFIPLYQNTGRPMIQPSKEVPITITESDISLTPKPFDESYMFQGYEILPDDPNDPENTRRLQEEYYRRQSTNNAQYQQQPNFGQGEYFTDRDPIDSSEIGYKPM